MSTRTRRDSLNLQVWHVTDSLEGLDSLWPDDSSPRRRRRAHYGADLVANVVLPRNGKNVRLSVLDALPSNFVVAGRDALDPSRPNTLIAFARASDLNGIRKVVTWWNNVLPYPGQASPGEPDLGT